MIEKLMLRMLDAVPRSEKEQAVRAQMLIATNLQSENNRLRAKVIGKEANEKKVLRVIDASVGDPEPSDARARSEYVGLVTNFYDGILEKKLLQLIAQTREAQDTIFVEVPQGMDRSAYDSILKGTSNAYKVLMDWCEIMKGEHLTNIQPDANQ